MKKVMLLSTAMCVLGLDTACGMMEMYNPTGGTIVRREEAQTLAKADEVAGAVASANEVNFRTIQPSLLLSENAVSALIKEYSRTDSTMTQIGEPIEKQYPLQRELLRYVHDFSQGYSYPVQKLFVHIDDIEFADRSGDIVLDEEYTAEEKGIMHQKRPVGRYEMDDEHLLAKQLSEIFITTETGEQVIDEAKVRAGEDPISYVRTATPATVRNIGVPESRAGDNEFNYQKTETSEEYMRPDGTPFVKKTEDWQRVAKPKPPAPVQAAPQVVVNQPAPGGGGNGNIFHHWFGW